MTELELYKYIHDNSIEWRREVNEGSPDILIFPYVFQLEDFCKLIKAYNADDGGLVIRLLNGYCAIWMNDICEYFAIDIDKVFVGGGC
jgi:hypothetical protein